MERIDISGKRFGRLLVLRYSHASKTGAAYVCLCECGKQTTTTRARLISGHTKSCGCLKAEVIKAGAHTSHGLTNTPEYETWQNIKTRCYNPANRTYRFYGALGVKVCQQWMESFSRFYADMGPRPSAEHTIERNDPHGDYEPSNCVWLHRSRQRINRRDSILFTLGGESKVLKNWCRHYGIPYERVYCRMKKGWSFEAALFTPKLKG